MSRLADKPRDSAVVCDDIENLAPACRRCNQLKSKHDLESFRRLLAIVGDFFHPQPVGFADSYAIYPGPSARDFEFWFEKRGLHQRVAVTAFASV
jgi:hypothetical protein